MPRHDVPLELLITAVLDGQALDWATTESSATNEAQRAQIRQFRTLATIAALQREPDATDRIPNVIPDSTPELWGTLRLLERIGTGSFGEVYRAWDRRLDREVALKLLRNPTVGGQPDSGVVDEGRLLARVRHPNVVTVHGADIVNWQVGIWMELVPGRTLEALVCEAGPFEWRDAATTGTTICRALDAVHAAGLVHRDINAKNVMREDDGRIVLMDFGAGQSPADSGPGLVGTPVYLAPELFEGGAANRTTDIYSVGVLLYHLVTGSYPVVGGTLEEIRDAHRHARRTPLRSHRSDLPEDFVGVIERATNPNPTERFGRAFAMGAALEASLTAASEHPTGAEKAIAGEQPAWRTAGWLGRRTTRAQVASVAIVALVGLVAAGVYASVWRPRIYERSLGVAGVAAGDPVPPSATPTPASVPNQTDAVEPLNVALHFRGRDWVLITAFENKTGETVLDGTLEFAMERELSNSPFVNVAPRERIDDVLQLMQRPKDARVDVRLGREICLRDGGIRALLSGRVERIGTEYVVTSQIVNPADGVVLKSLTEDAGQQTELLQAIRRLAFRVRETLGEMIVTIQTSQVALDKVTTPSLHALQLYSQASGFLHGENWKNEAAEPLLKQAIAEDTRFASAYILLAHAIHNQGRPKEDYIPYASRAAELANDTSDVERYFILGSYHQLLGGSLEGTRARDEHRQALAAYEALLGTKPDHYWAVVNLANLLDALNPDDANNPFNLSPKSLDAWARAADIRAESPSLNLSVARRLFMGGAVIQGRRHMRRAEALIGGSPGEHLAAFWLSREALLNQDIVQASQFADEWTRRLRKELAEPRQEVGEVRFDVINTYLDLGRLREARLVELLQPGASVNGMVDWALFVLGHPAGSQRLRDYITTHATDAKPGAPSGLWALYAHYFSQLDMLDELRALHRRSAEKGSGVSESHLVEIEGHLAFAEGHLDKAIGLFHDAQNLRGRDHWARRRLALEVADALKTNADIAGAVAVLERETVNWPLDVWDGGGIAYWVAAKDRLSDLYQWMARTNEAQSIDAELLKLLALADTDHPVLAHIKARRASSQDRR